MLSMVPEAGVFNHDFRCHVINWSKPVVPQSKIWNLHCSSVPKSWHSCFEVTVQDRIYNGIRVLIDPPIARHLYKFNVMDMYVIQQMKCHFLAWSHSSSRLACFCRAGFIGQMLSGLDLTLHHCLDEQKMFGLMVWFNDIWTWENESAPNLSSASMLKSNNCPVKFTPCKPPFVVWIPRYATWLGVILPNIRWSFE